MKCCGSERSTKFCSDCGTLLWTSPIYGLLAQTKKTCESYERRLKKAEDAGEKTKGWLQRTAKRWRQYHDALDDMIGNP